MLFRISRRICSLIRWYFSSIPFFPSLPVSLSFPLLLSSFFSRCLYFFTSLSFPPGGYTFDGELPRSGAILETPCAVDYALRGHMKKINRLYTYVYQLQHTPRGVAAVRVGVHLFSLPPCVTAVIIVICIFCVIQSSYYRFFSTYIAETTHYHCATGLCLLSSFFLLGNLSRYGFFK